ncbi:unnamed protein product [Pleuronectes platessa]|uniref:Uncharacterized protein n=1 Tax=Pleuronectes platessa TaxID=8262 RepID=A0A9N7Z479_PLEPL|nr:unnamed protein product [Pleuronectes platessa]
MCTVSPMAVDGLRAAASCCQPALTRSAQTLYITSHSLTGCHLKDPHITERVSLSPPHALPPANIENVCIAGPRSHAMCIPGPVLTHCVSWILELLALSVLLRLIGRFGFLSRGVPASGQVSDSSLGVQVTYHTYLGSPRG